MYGLASLLAFGMQFLRNSIVQVNDQIDMNTAVILLKSLNSFVQSLRDRFDDFEQDGALRSGATQ